LKGRQQGFTTIINAYGLSQSITRKNFSGYTLADDSDNTEAIFEDKVKYPFDHLPQAIQPSIKYNTKRELDFKDKEGGGLNSKMRVATAGKKDAGRSKTLNYLHISEGGFMELKKLLVGLGEALTQNVLAVIESTANGYNDFKEYWDADNNWENIFYEWWRTSEYRLEFITKEDKEEFILNLEMAEPSEEVQSRNWAYSRCRWLYETIGLDLEQSYWYFDKWKDKQEMIKQEYPCTSDEAFLSSGRGYFNNTKITERQAEVKLESTILRKGYFEYDFTTDSQTKNKIIDKKTVKWVDSTFGYVEIYIEPNEYETYAIGGDTATDGTDRNFSQVLDSNYNQVARLIIDKDEDLYADHTVMLGYMYNNALIGIEVNHSTHPIKVVRERLYPNIYVRGQNPDSIKDKHKGKLGFHTNSGNRNSILGEFRTLAREHIEKVNDLVTLNEMLTFIIDDTGKPIAETGKHDDSILSFAIAMFIMDQAPRKKAIDPDDGKSKILRHKEGVVASRRSKTNRIRRRL